MILAQGNGQELLAIDNVFGYYLKSYFPEVQGCIQNCNVQRMEASLINLRKMLKIFAGSEKTRYLEEGCLGENYEKQ